MLKSRGTSPLLSLEGITKSFGGLAALKSVDLELFPGETVGLVGDNGAGKSTLIKILSGVLAPDSGRLILAGKPIDFRTYNVRKARQMGIETVYQDRSLGEKQPLWRNVFVGRPVTNKLGFIRVQERKRATMEILQHHVGLRGTGITPDAPIKHLSGGERQGLAIGRAMYFDAGIIILDEPTTALSLKEVDKVLTFVGGIHRQNKACVYISHNMGHVYRVAHRIVMLDRGRIVGEYAKTSLSLEELGAKLVQIQAVTEGQTQ